MSTGGKEGMLIKFSSKRPFRGNTGSNKKEEKSLKVYKSHTGKCFILIPNHRYVMK